MCECARVTFICLCPLYTIIFSLLCYSHFVVWFFNTLIVFGCRAFLCLAWLFIVGTLIVWPAALPSLASWDIWYLGAYIFPHIRSSAVTYAIIFVFVICMLHLNLIFSLVLPVYWQLNAPMLWNIRFFYFCARFPCGLCRLRDVQTSSSATRLCPKASTALLSFMIIQPLVLVLLFL